MRIYDRNLTGTSAGEAARAQETLKTGSGSSARSGSTQADGSGDRFELSSAAGLLSRTLSAFGSDRAGHVAALTKQYQAGNYQPDSLATSQGIVSETLSAGIQ